MASTTAAHAVLFNGDLFTLILPHLDTKAIRHLRLVCRTLEDAASPHLFRTLHLNLSKRSFRRLHRSAASPHLAKGVREIIWDTTHYSTFGNRYTQHDVAKLGALAGLWCVHDDDEAYTFEEVMQEDYLYPCQGMEVTLARLRALAKDEQDLIERIERVEVGEEGEEEHEVWGGGLGEEMGKVFSSVQRVAGFGPHELVG